MIKKFITKKGFLDYIYNAFTGNLLGFIIGMSATGIVSRFFETRSISNLYGFRAKKTIVSKGDFENLEWAISIFIGFFVLEFYDKVLKEKLRELISRYYKIGMDHSREKGWLDKAEKIKLSTINQVKEKSIIGKEKIKEVYNNFQEHNKLK